MADLQDLARRAGAEITDFINYAFDEPMILMDKVALARFAALVAAECIAIAEAIHAEAADVAHPDAEGWTAECVTRLRAAFPVPKE